MTDSGTQMRRQGGFTLIEVMVVVLILGMMTKLAISNMGAWIPESALDSQANQLRSWLDYLRSEAKIQGKPYSLELDLEGNRVRLILPPEDKLVTTMDDTIAETIPLNWTQIEDWVKFGGHAVSGGEIRTQGDPVLITFDENGFSADQSIYFSYDEPDSKMMWTVHLHGLSGTTEVIRNFEGTRQVFRAMEESNF